MQEILNTFGVTWEKFFAQVIIFLIVYLVLKKFAFGPVMQMLDERKARIVEGEANLEKIKKDLEEAEAKARSIVEAANGKAERMVTDAQESAEALGAKKRDEAAHEAGQILAKAREAARLEQEKMSAELKRDFSRLVVDTTAKVTGKVLTKDDQDQISRETAGQIAL